MTISIVGQLGGDDAMARRFGELAPGARGWLDAAIAADDERELILAAWEPAFVVAAEVPPGSSEAEKTLGARFGGIATAWNACWHAAAEIDVIARPLGVSDAERLAESLVGCAAELAPRAKESPSPKLDKLGPLATAAANASAALVPAYTAYQAGVLSVAKTVADPAGLRDRARRVHVAMAGVLDVPALIARRAGETRWSGGAAEDELRDALGEVAGMLDGAPADAARALAASLASWDAAWGAVDHALGARRIATLAWGRSLDVAGPERWAIVAALAGRARDALELGAGVRAAWTVTSTEGPVSAAIAEQVVRFDWGLAQLRRLYGKVDAAFAPFEAR
ncbi:MAG TPA: hypothetical protein VL463_33220 [Kofleriaceae bacterium]|jgi:hypothetical protein|nr:hypothetical protein [Kofleriaceae bacterium]